MDSGPTPRGVSRNDDYPDLRLLVFWVRLPCAACSRMLCFSSSRWPLVVSSGTVGVLPGPLWLCSSSGTGWMVLVNGFVIVDLRWLENQRHLSGEVSAAPPVLASGEKTPS